MDKLAPCRQHLTAISAELYLIISWLHWKNYLTNECFAILTCHPGENRKVIKTEKAHASNTSVFILIHTLINITIQWRGKCNAHEQNSMEEQIRDDNANETIMSTFVAFWMINHETSLQNNKCKPERDCSCGHFSSVAGETSSINPSVSHAPFFT